MNQLKGDLKGSICYTNVTNWKHSGGFYVCNTGIQIWVLTRITSDKLVGQEPIPCLQQKGTDYIKFNEMQEGLTLEQLEKVCGAYDNNYISMAKDISRGPKSGCEFAGVVVKKWCSSPFECNKGSYTWRDYSQLTSSELTYRSFSSITSMLPKSLYSSSCPSGGINIQKQEGCSHMTGRYCNYEFCWDCLGHYPNYVHETYAMCWLRPIMNQVLYYTVGLLLVSYAFSKFRNHYELFVRIMDFSMNTLVLDYYLVLFMIVEYLLMNSVKATRSYNFQWKIRKICLNSIGIILTIILLYATRPKTSLSWIQGLISLFLQTGFAKLFIFIKNRRDQDTEDEDITDSHEDCKCD